MRKYILALTVTLVCFASQAQEVKLSTEASGEVSSLPVSELLSTEVDDAVRMEAGRIDTLAFNRNFNEFLQFDRSGSPFSVYYPGMYPFIRSYSNSGLLGVAAGISFIGSGSYNEHPYLLTSRSASFGLSRDFGQLGMIMGMSATNYVGMDMPSFYQYGVNMQLEYRMSDVMSVVAFGQYYNNVPFVTMANYPFINTSRYGGYVSLTGDRVGIDLGAQRYFDPVSRQWETVPIITPKFKVNDNLSIGVSVGGMVKNGVERMSQRNQPLPPPPSNGHNGRR